MDIVSNVLVPFISTNYVSSCGTLSNMTSPTNLSFPTVAYNSIILNWTPGIGSTKTLIVRKQGSIPANKEDGTTIYLDNGNAFIDTGLTTSIQYCYALYGTDGIEYTEPVAGCATTISTGLVFNRIFDGDYVIEKYTLPSNSNVSASGTWVSPSGVHEIEILIVAGGGGGAGARYNGNGTGGGGGGGLIYRSSYHIENDFVLVGVGKGGNGGGTPFSGEKGDNSYFGSLEVEGGGYGAVWDYSGGNGGSGGGGGCYNHQGGLSYSNQGNSGGAGGTSSTFRGGGGGGAGSAGLHGDSGGHGGNGLQFSLTGTPLYYAGGGGGGIYYYNPGGNGGLGGGGKGGNSGPYDGQAGVDGTGGGGGGGGCYNQYGLGGRGGSGIVIIRYLNPEINIDGVCGTAVRTFAHNEDSYVSYTQCSVGIPSNTNFPAQGSSETWTCSGQNGGSASSNCTASRDSAPWACGNTLIDSRNSKTYNTVQIGTQCWMKENMDYNNGCQSVTWANNTDNGWCGYYTGGPYANEGLLYQWSAAMNGSTTAGAQGICPAGWHVPTHDEWTTMERSINGSTAFPYDTTTTGWLGTNEGSKLSLLTLNGTNSTGFTALMSGYRYIEGSFVDRSSGTIIWSSSPSGVSAWDRYMNTVHSTVTRRMTSKALGMSVRCLKN